MINQTRNEPFPLPPVLVLVQIPVGAGAFSSKQQTKGLRYRLDQALVLKRGREPPRFSSGDSNVRAKTMRTEMEMMTVSKTRQY